MVGCDDPYIGELSIMPPPASKKARTTSARASRAAGSLPTLNVIQVPSPTTGNGSPVEGMGRVIRRAPGVALTLVCADTPNASQDRPDSAAARDSEALRVESVPLCADVWWCFICARA